MKVNSIIPKTKFRLIVLLAFLGYLLTLIFYDFYTADLDLFNLSEQQANFEYLLRILRWASLKIVFAIVIIGGLINLRRKGFSVKKIAIPIFGSLLCLFYSWDTWISHKTIEDTKNIFAGDKERINTIEATLTKLMDNPKDNFENILFVVKHRYAIDGKRIKYPDKSGKLIIFKPSKDDLLRLKEKNRTKTTIAQAGEKLKFESYFWVFFLIACNIVGLFVPISRIGFPPVTEA